MKGPQDVSQAVGRGYRPAAPRLTPERRFLLVRATKSGPEAALENIKEMLSSN